MKKAIFYLTKPLNFVYPQISGSVEQVEAYLNNTQNIESKINAVLHQDIDYTLNVLGLNLKFRYVKGYILVKEDSPYFYRFLERVNQAGAGWFSLPLFRQPNDPYLVRFVSTIDDKYNIWAGLFV